MDEVLEGFRTGQGVGYDNYPRFQQFMGQLADAKHREVLVEAFLPSVDNGAIVRQMEAGIRVCDLGCAEGVALMLMARRFPAAPSWESISPRRPCIRHGSPPPIKH